MHEKHIANTPSAQVVGPGTFLCVFFGMTTNLACEFGITPTQGLKVVPGGAPTHRACVCEAVGPRYDQKENNIQCT